MTRNTALEIAARVWQDQEMTHLVMHEQTAKLIALALFIIYEDAEESRATEIDPEVKP